MSDWIDIEKYYKFLELELKARHRREEFLREYFGNWTDEEEEKMGNRKRVKGVKGMRPSLTAIDEIENLFAGRYNAYLCGNCDGGFLTLDVDVGVTPMFLRCYATEGCNGRAKSAMYPKGNPPAYLGEPILHWVRPTNLNKVPAQLVDHVNRGGLICQPTEAAPDWVKELF